MHARELHMDQARKRLPQSTRAELPNVAGVETPELVPDAVLPEQFYQCGVFLPLSRKELHRGVMKEGLLYERTEEQSVICNLCAHRCLIRPGRIGVYCGNLPGSLHEGTDCYHCGQRMVEWEEFTVRRIALQKGHCPYCQTPIDGVWEDSPGTGATTKRPAQSKEEEVRL